jgi:hypothetical protein
MRLTWLSEQGEAVTRCAADAGTERETIAVYSSSVGGRCTRTYTPPTPRPESALTWTMSVAVLAPVVSMVKRRHWPYRTHPGRTSYCTNAPSAYWSCVTRKLYTPRSGRSSLRLVICRCHSASLRM